MINSYVALDLETTGLNPVQDGILEIGVVKVLENEVIDTYQTFVRFEGSISNKIKELTGITDDMAAGGLDIATALKEVFDFCEDYVLLGHNIQFDFSFLKAKAVQAKKNFAARGIDTLKIARKVLPDIEKRSLEYLSGYYQIEKEASHRALEDAYTAMKLYRIFQSEYGNNTGLFEPAELIYKMKKESGITAAQKGYLNDLLKYHTIEHDINIDALTKSEASKIIDSIILEYGKIRRGFPNSRLYGA